MKKAMTLIMAAAMCAGMALSVIASEVDARRAPPCSFCDGALYLSNTEYTTWKNTGIATNCIHNDPLAKDIIQTRIVIKTYTCGSCGMDEVFESTQERQVHP